MKPCSCNRGTRCFDCELFLYEVLRHFNFTGQALLVLDWQRSWGLILHDRFVWIFENLAKALNVTFIWLRNFKFWDEISYKKINKHKAECIIYFQNQVILFIYFCIKHLWMFLATDFNAKTVLRKIQWVLLKYYIKEYYNAVH